MCDANAATLTATQLERVIFQSLMMSPDFEKSRLGVRALAEQFPNDDSVCDYVAERLLKEPDPTREIAVDAIAWYATTLGDSCSARYHDALSLARQRYTSEKVVKYLDLALARPADNSTPQYAEGGVDLLARRSEIEQQLRELEPGSASGISQVTQGMPFGEVIERAGVPRDFSSLTLRVARWGRSTVLVAHYGGSAMLIFRHDTTSNRWTLADSFPELSAVNENFKGTQFAVAQTLTCLRGLPFRDYIKINARTISRDPRLMWVLANRISATPFPADEFEQDAMLVAVEWMVRLRSDESLAMLKQIAAAPGDKVPKVAGEYVEKLERRAAKTQAVSP
jgi:hypothetical protein